MKGYQYLEINFFELCKTRKIKPIPMLLYIYLRGLYCRFQKPIFFYIDKQIEDHLGFNHKALQRARHALQEKGLIKFTSGIGRKPTTYHMLGTVLLPEGMANMSRQTGQAKHRQSGHIGHTYNTSKERIKNKVGIDNDWQKEALRAIKRRTERKKSQTLYP